MVQRFQMLPPQGVPADTLFVPWAFRGSAKELARLGSTAGAARTNVHMAEALRRVLSTNSVELQLSSPEAPQTEDAAHDAYFHVDRVAGDSPAIFAQMALRARLIFLEEVDEAPIGTSAELLDMIDRALAELFACLCGEAVGSAPLVTEWESRGQVPQVMRRWIRGHQIFAALTQGLVLSFQSMGRAIRNGRAEDVRRWADLTISLLRGSGASFVLTGDFSVDDYNEVVRPSMMPPAAPFCLSGLMSADHRCLVQTMKEMRPALKALHLTERARHDRLYEALSTVYDRHIHVCERFVGTRPSLLTAGSTEKSGPVLLDQFKTLRLKSIESTVPAKRMAPRPHAAPEARCPFPGKAATTENPTDQ